MIIRNRLLLKSFAVFFIVEMLVNTVAPAVSWALTAGPTAPEFSSFEPVDTTDMVNLATGELVYNIPLLEVPGPSGGYPLSLSYHAGIKNDQESSWVGLGWTLNPGAINRTVNGAADDNTGARREMRDYWDGGETTTKTYTLGVSIPNTGIGVSYTLAKTQDTFKGFSSNGQVGISINPIAMGQAFASGGFGKTKKMSAAERKEKLKPGADKKNEYKDKNNVREVLIDKGFQTLSANTSLDFSISSKGIRSTATIAGYTLNQQNNSAGKISSFSNSTDRGGFVFWVFSVALRDFYTRYWSDQSDAMYTYGTLYSSKNNVNSDYWDHDVDYNSAEFRTFSNDMYDLFEPVENNDEANIDFNGQNDQSRHIGGSLPAYDRYQVTAQGLGGLMQPYIFENGDLRGQNTYFRGPMGWPVQDYPSVKYQSMRQFSANKKVDFRFKNDFSNSLTVAPSIVQSSFTTGPHAVHVFDEGFDDTGGLKQQLAGSRHIEWVTNQEVVNGTAQAKGFIDYYAAKTDRPLTRNVYADYLQPEACLPFDRMSSRGKGSGIVKTDSYDQQDPYEKIPSPSHAAFNSLKPTPVSLAEKVGGFMITNESGVTYHYALPVYAYNEYTRTKMKKPRKGAATITEIKNTEPYAYSWLLTAITGPDFVDRGPNGANGILDDHDYGYWVKFDYGLWADAYQWRTPFTDYMTDYESDYESFSYGIKQLYYLDAVETKTHKALFVKSKRKDGRGTTSRLEGGSNPREFNMKYKLEDGTQSTMRFSVSPVSTMKLDAIYLFDKEKLKNIVVNKAAGAKYNDAPMDNPYTYPYQGNEYRRTITSDKVVVINSSDYIPVTYHNGNLVLDDGDIATISDFNQNALKIIEFGTDYSLASGVSNSVDDYSGLELTNGCNTSQSCQEITGPFDFEWPSGVNTNCYTTTDRRPGCCPTDADRHMFYSYWPVSHWCSYPTNDYSGPEMTYRLTGKLTLKELRTLGHGGAAMIPPTKFAYDFDGNFNPQYQSERYDEWGYYKSDYFDREYIYTPESELPPDNEVVGSRKITTASAAQTHAWSLSSIQHPLGSKVNIRYEPNTYSKNIYNDNFTFSIAKVLPGRYGFVRVYLKEQVPLSTYFAVGQSISITGFIVSKYSDNKTHREVYRNEGTNSISSIENGCLEISSPVLYQLINAGRTYTEGGSSWALMPYFVAGFVWLPDQSPVKYAGGIRVKSLELAFNGHNSSTEYSYEIPGSSTSSGVTSYKPYHYPAIHYPTDIDFFNTLFSTSSIAMEQQRRELLNDQALYYHEVNKLYGDLLLFTREAPGPGALYEYVTVKNKYDGRYVDQHTVNQFEVFKRDMLSATTTFSDKSDNGDNVFYRRKHITIRNNSINVGSLKNVSFYGKGVLLKTINYGYLNDETDEPFESAIRQVGQGLVQQSFHKYIVVNDWLRNFFDSDSPPSLISQHHKAVITKMEESSNVLTSVEEKDYKTGVTTRTENHEFNYYTGGPVGVKTVDAYGNHYFSISEPAYKFYPSMGLKMNGGKNMLTQEAAAYVYKVDPNDSQLRTALVSASTQTWSDTTKITGATNGKQPGIWRKEASYVWKGDDAALRSDGMYPYSNFQSKPFNFFNPSASDAQWQKDNQITLYNVQSHALEASDINGQYAATRMSTDNHVVYATAANARYDEFAYTGVEDNAEGGKYSGVEMLDGAEVFALDDNDKQTAHTGHKAVKLTSENTKTLRFSLPAKANKIYRASVWTNSPQGRLFYKLNGATSQAPVVPTAKKQAGTWYLLETNITASQQGTLEVWCETLGGTCHFDDFRVHPADAPMVSYVYNKWGELSHIIDNNNLYTEYRYDNMSRLKETYRESFQRSYGNEGVVKLGEINYNYGVRFPFTIPISSSTTGIGQLFPLGTMVINQGESQSFTAKESCSTPKFLRFVVDDQVISQPTVTLFDGTIVDVDGKTISFRNVQSEHSVRAEFQSGACDGGLAQIVAPTPTNGSVRTVNGCSSNENKTTTIVASLDGGYTQPFTYQWEYSYSASGTIAWMPVGTNSPTLEFSFVGANGSGAAVHCKITDGLGSVRYTNSVVIFYSCPGLPGSSDCLPGCYWNAQQGRCDCTSTCGDGCWWNGFECVCP